MITDDSVADERRPAVDDRVCEEIKSILAEEYSADGGLIDEFIQEYGTFFQLSQGELRFRYGKRADFVAKLLFNTQEVITIPKMDDDGAANLQECIDDSMKEYQNQIERKKDDMASQGERIKQEIEETIETINKIEEHIKRDNKDIEKFTGVEDAVTKNEVAEFYAEIDEILAGKPNTNQSHILTEIAKMVNDVRGHCIKYVGTNVAHGCVYTALRTAFENIITMVTGKDHVYNEEGVFDCQLEHDIHDAVELFLRREAAQFYSDTLEGGSDVPPQSDYRNYQPITEVQRDLIIFAKRATENWESAFLNYQRCIEHLQEQHEMYNEAIKIKEELCKGL